MNILFEDKEKKFKTSFLKDLENNVKILKNLFDEVYIDKEGVCYSLENKLNNGRVLCRSSLNKLFDIDDWQLLKLNLKLVSDCLKAGKSKIIGYSVTDKLIIRTIEMDYEVGVFENDIKLNIDYLNDIFNNIEYTCDLSDILPKFENKEFVSIKRNNYDLILTHKLFPVINKAVDFEFGAKSNDNGTFFGVFTNRIEERNKKEEITFQIEVIYVYRFLYLI